MSLLASLEEPATPVPPTPGRPLHHSFDPSLSESQSHLEEEQDKGSVSDYVRYLLDGSGAEGEVDFGRLRKELLDSSKPEASIDRDRFPNAPKSSQPIDASNAPPTPTPTSTRPISPLPNNAPCNPDVKSASTALESELLKWRISKSQWNAEIAARRASLEQVHRMIHDEETFGGGMTVVLEGLVGLKELALNGGNEDMKNGKSGENVGRGDGQGGLRRSRNNSNPGSPPNGGSPNPSLDAELEERRRQLDHERESYASLPLNRESLVSLPRDRSPPRDRSVGRQALDSRDRSIPREKSMAREKSVPRDRSLPREQATSRRTTEYSVVDREFDQHRGRNEERDRDRDNRESYENRESNSDRTRQFDRERQDRDWDYDRERDFERQRESLPPLPRSKVPQTPATATYLNSSVGSGSGQAGNDELASRLAALGLPTPPIPQSVVPLLSSLLDMHALSQTQLDSFRATLDSVSRSTSMLREENEALRSALDEERRGREQVEKEVDEARGMMELAESVVDSLRAERDASEARIATEREDARRAVDEARGGVEKLRAENGRLRGLAGKLRERCTALDASNAERGRTIESLGRETEELRAQLDRVRREGRDRVEAEEVERERRGRMNAEAELTALRREVETERRKREDAEARVGELRGEVGELKARARELEMVARQEKQGPVQVPQTPRTVLEKSGISGKVDGLADEVRRLRGELERRDREDKENRAAPPHQVQQPVPPTPGTQIARVQGDVKGLQEEVRELREELEARRRAERVRKMEEREEREGGGEIEHLKHLLESAQRDLEHQREQTELLKLQVLATKRAEWVSRSSAPKKPTRDAIKKDKAAYRLKLWEVEGVEVEELQEICKEICLKLDVDDLSKILPALDEIEAALKLLPQVRSFAAQVDALVWDSNESRGPTRKLAETLRVLETWAAGMAELARLRRFRGDVHEALNVPEAQGSEAVCVEEIGALKGRGNAGGKKMDKSGGGVDDSAAKMVRHFRNLFDVPDASAVIPRINQLYVFEAEVESGLRRLRSMLKLQSKKPSEILAEAIRFVAGRVGVRGREGGLEY